MKEMTWHAVHLERGRGCVEARKRLLMKTQEGLISFSSQGTMNSVRINDNMLKYILPVYVEFQFNIEKTFQCTATGWLLS